MILDRTIAWCHECITYLSGNGNGWAGKHIYGIVVHIHYASNETIKKSYTILLPIAESYELDKPPSPEKPQPGHSKQLKYN